MTLRTTVFILFAFMHLLLAQSQTYTEDVRTLQGYLISALDSTPVSYAHIHNESLRTSAVSDSSGFFTIKATRDDSLVFSAVNYLPKLFVVPAEHLVDTIIQVTLKERIYEIGEVSVFGIGSYRQFKQKVLSMDIPESPTEKLQQDILDSSRSVAMKVAENMELEELYNRSPLEKVRIATIPIYSKDEKERLKLKEVIEKEIVQEQVDKKFNKEIISRLTGLNEHELTDFYVYLDFSDTFILTASEYEIQKAIVNKFKVYLKEKNEQKRLDSIIR